MSYVIVQPEGDFEPLISWWIGSDPEVQKRQWEDLCLKFVEEARARSDRRGEDSTTPLFNVFLLFDEEEFPDGLQLSALEDLLDQARKRIWGARLFFVVPPLKISRDLYPIMESLGDWMTALLRQGVTDLVQVPHSYAAENQEPLLKALRNAAIKAQKRQQFLYAMADHREWRCAFLTAQYEGRALVSELLEPLVIGAPSERGHSNMLLVVTDEILSVEGLNAYTYTDDPMHRNCLVATVNRVPSDALSGFCKEQRLAPPLDFRGELELWYFLLQLNQLRQWFPPSVHGASSIHAVHAQPESILQPVRQFPSLLFTSAFSSDDEEKPQWLAAAGEVGRLLRVLPHALEQQVELVIQPERLVQALKSNPQPNVWIHMGHDSASSGLQIPGMDVTQERWVECFKQCDLRLVLFLTCDSHEIAKVFAQSGAGVAIGFEGKVESDKGWHLAAAVLKAIFTLGTSRQVILEAFESGAGAFRGVRTVKATPRAYYARGRR